LFLLFVVSSLLSNLFFTWPDAGSIYSFVILLPTTNFFLKNIDLCQLSLQVFTSYILVSVLLYVFHFISFHFRGCPPRTMQHCWHSLSSQN
jgi:hypothetical protein